MDKWTQRATVLIIGVFIWGCGAGGIYLATESINMPDWLQNVLILALGILTPSPLQGGTRRTDPVSVTIDQPANDPVPVEETK